MELKDSKFFKKDLSEHGQILTVELSPFDLSQDVILIGFNNKILLGHLKIEDNLELEIIAEFRHPSRCTCLGISPETSLNILPNLVLFSAGGSDFKLRVFRSSLKGDDTCKILNGHSSYINDTKFDPNNGYLVSVSDDNTAKLWETDEFKCVATLHLTSPGITAFWHRDDTSKLLVAEKIGLVRFYNVETQSPILSLDYGKLLSSAHWAPSDPQLVASLQLGEVVMWDLSKPCVPIGSTLLFTECGGYLRFSAFGEFLAAVNALEGNLKIIDVRSQRLKLSTNVTLPSNVTWHFRYPIVCIGDYNCICFWKV